MIKLVDVYNGGGVKAGVLEFLYELMKERDPEINISHSTLPTFEQHRQFVTRRPYRCWYLVCVSQGPIAGVSGAVEFEPVWTGYVSATHHNEIGVVLLKAYRGRGIGSAAVRALMQLHEPLPAGPSVRNGHWLANIAPRNEHSKHVFEKLGFREIQRTYQLQERTS